MARLIRLDTELVRRGMARSRTQAGELIKTGRVMLDGVQVLKPARQVDPAQALVIQPTQSITYASRGAHKLLSAVDYLEKQGFHVEYRDHVALDAGASTGGFTDVLLRKGARKVYAVDVGYGQLAWSLRVNKAVEVRERTNVRYLEAKDFDPQPSWVVGDLSFISLTLVIPALLRISTAEANFLLMVKPQFEVGKEQLAKGAIVTDVKQHIQSVEKVAQCVIDNGARVLALAPSFLPGSAGNVEYFVYFTKDKNLHGLDSRELKEAIVKTVEDGPAMHGQAMSKNVNYGDRETLECERKNDKMAKESRA